MKKTFKVKNILKNKNKYNFKTELLLSALSLLVAFGTVSCKKDPVKPKNNTENPVDKKEKEFRIVVKALKPLGLYEDFMSMVNQGDPNFSFKTFYDSIVGNVYFIDQKKGEESLRVSNTTLEQLSLGYRKAAYSAKKDIRDINGTKEQIDAIDKIVEACEEYLKEYEMQNKIASNSR